MELKIFSIRDSKGEYYSQPLFARSHGDAERHFTKLANDPNSTVNSFPEDYDLYYIGTFDDSLGVVSPLDTPQHLIKATHVAKRGNAPGPNTTP